MIICIHLSSTPTGATSGKEFYVTFFGNFDDTATYYLYVTTLERQPISFTIDARGTGYSANGAVWYGEVANYTFNPSEYELMSTTDRGKAIIVRSETDGEVTVYGGNLQQFTSDSFLLLPKQPEQEQSTYKYIVASYISNRSGQESSVAIIAQYNSTLLSITPRVDTTIGTTFTPAGATTNISLQEAETLLTAITNDLTGLTVMSNKPLAVLSGVKCANVPITAGACDHLVEQIPPVSSWGRRFATAPLKGRQSYDVFRVLASENSITVVVNCTSSSAVNPENLINTYQLSEGRFVEFNVTSNQYCFIQGSANILVLQYATGSATDNLPGDPSMIIVPAITQYCNQYSLPTIQPSVGSFNFDHYMNILIPTQFYQLDQIILNNQSLNRYNFTFTVIKQGGDPQVYAAQVNLTEGVHTLYHTNPAATLGVIMYGFAHADSYGHPGGLQLTQGTNARSNYSVYVYVIYTYVHYITIAFSIVQYNM